MSHFWYAALGNDPYVSTIIEEKEKENKSILMFYF